VGVERRPVHRLIACAARPGRVSAAVTEAGLVADEDLARAERVTIRAAPRAAGHIHLLSVVRTSSPISSAPQCY
jgi:hypothetical protein